MSLAKLRDYMLQIGTFGATETPKYSIPGYDTAKDAWDAANDLAEMVIIALKWAYENPHAVLGGMAIVAGTIGASWAFLQRVGHEAAGPVAEQARDFIDQLKIGSG